MASLLLLTLLHVLLEGRSSGDGLSRILVVLGFRVAGIEHTSGTLLGLLTIKGGGTGGANSGGEGGGGGGGMEMKMEFRQLREAMDHIQEKADRSAMIEKKMLLALESLTTKIDSLLGRENDFKFLRNNVGQDWMK